LLNFRSSRINYPAYASKAPCPLWFSDVFRYPEYVPKRNVGEAFAAQWLGKEAQRESFEISEPIDI